MKTGYRLLHRRQSQERHSHPQQIRLLPSAPNMRGYSRCDFQGKKERQGTVASDRAIKIQRGAFGKEWPLGGQSCWWLSAWRASSCSLPCFSCLHPEESPGAGLPGGKKAVCVWFPTLLLPHPHPSNDKKNESNLQAVKRIKWHKAYDRYSTHFK